MKESKLIELLKLLDGSGWKRFSLFVASPYFNTSQKTTELCEYLKSCSPDYPVDMVNNQACYEALYPGGTFNANQFSRYSSKLYKLLEQFFAYSKFESKPIYQRHFLSEKLFELKAYEHLDKLQKLQHRDLDQQKPVSSEVLFYRYLLQKLKYNYVVQKKKSRNATEIFDRASKTLDQYYLVEMLQASATQASAIVGYEGLLQDPNIQNPFYEVAVSQIASKYDSFPVLVRVWYLANKLLRKNNSADIYSKLKQELLENVLEIPPLDARNMLTLLRSVVPIRFRENRQLQFRELFELYKLEAESGLMYTGNILPYQQLVNMINIALKLDEVSWASETLEASIPYVFPEAKQDIYHFNRASIDFHEGNYKDCLKHLLNIYLRESILTLGIKRMQLKVYYELDDITSFFQTLNALRVYLHRYEQKNGTNQTAVQHLKFTNIINTIFKAKIDKRSGTDLSVIQKEILGSPRLPEYDWLLEKIVGL